MQKLYMYTLVFRAVMQWQVRLFYANLGVNMKPSKLF